MYTRNMITKEQILEKKRIITDKVSRTFYALYVIVTFASFLYYVIYDIYSIIKNGWHLQSILLTVFVGVYAISLLICFGFSSNKQLAKKNFSKVNQKLKIVKRLMKIVNIAASLVVVYESVTRNEHIDTTALMISLISLSMAVFRLGILIVKQSIKKKYNKYKLEKEREKALKKEQEILLKQQSETQNTLKNYLLKNKEIIKEKAKKGLLTIAKEVQETEANENIEGENTSEIAQSDKSDHTINIQVLDDGTEYIESQPIEKNKKKESFLSLLKKIITSDEEDKK